PVASRQGRNGRDRCSQAARNRSVLLVCLAADRLAPSFVRDPVTEVSLGRPGNLRGHAADPARGPALVQHRGCACRARSADDAYRRDCRDLCRAVLLPGLAECGGGGDARLASCLTWEELAHRSGERLYRSRGRGWAADFCWVCSAFSCVRPHCAERIPRRGTHRLRRVDPRWRAGSLARTENCVAACPVAIFPLVCNVGRRRPSCFAWIEGARGFEHWMSHPRVHYCRRLVG